MCRAWADDPGEPFVTCRGVIVTYEAFGRDPGGQTIDRHYRSWVASITKTVTGILFSQFVDQRLVNLGDSLAGVFPNIPRTTRTCPRSDSVSTTPAVWRATMSLAACATVRP